MRNTLARAAGEQMSLGSYPTYVQAQSVVEALAEQRFEVEQTQIIGSDLRMVEQVTGRLTWPRVLISGVVGGAWFGIFVGLLLNILTTASFGRAMSFGLTWGVIFGGVFAAVGYGLTAGRRDFASRSAIIPGRFEVLVTADHADHARTVLADSPR
ncbi:general stress protein [Catenulispora yoronensis]